MTDSIDNFIFQAPANPNLKDASGSSHDCLNKRLSRGEESGSDDEYEFDDENRNSHFGFSAEHEDDPFDTTKR